MEYMVTHIRRDRGDPDRRIDRLAGPSFNDTIDNVISAIDAGHEFYVLTGPRYFDAAYLEVKTHPVSYRRFVRTKPDGIWDNNLYALPEIP